MTKTFAAVEPLLYNMDQTSARLSLGRTMLYYEMAAGELEWLQIGDRRYTTNEQQLAYIARKQAAPKPAPAPKRRKRAA
jgi:hypothetical protein